MATYTLPYLPSRIQNISVRLLFHGIGRMCAGAMLLILYTCFLASTLAHSVGNNHSSEQKHQPLCYDDEKLSLLQFKQSFVLDCALAFDPTSAYPKMKSWKPHAADCCRWDGVKCDRRTGHVIGLDLGNSCLYGNFPSNNTIFELDHLLELNLSGNHFNFSQIPPAMGRLSKLISLDLSISFLSGQIPSELSQLSSLSLLDLSSHPDENFECQSPLSLHGPSMGNLFQNLTNLAVLDLSCVDISSTVPHSLGNMTTLTVLLLRKCNLYGQFPASILQLPIIEEIWLSYNPKLEGYFPVFPPHSALRVLYVAFTRFSGDLPPSIGNLHHLRELNLGDCYFSGYIPSSLGNLTQLTFLHLGGNLFEGSIPSCLRNLTDLHYLDLSGLAAKPNELNSLLSQLDKLTTLHLSNVNLGGDIPKFLTNLTALTELDLSHNQLTGSLPNWLVNMTQLTRLYLLENQLQGHVPQWLSQLTSLEELSLEYNNSTSTFGTFLKLKNLQNLQLKGVSLAFPPIASTNTSVQNFFYLELDFCNLSEFPQFLHNQSALQFLSLVGNYITGNIPQWFVNQTKDNLLFLNLNGNSLSGFEEHPVFLPWNSLEYLDLSRNKLRGLLPYPPTSLNTFLVSDNQFYGVIPKQICIENSLMFLDLSNNNMSGQIPHCIGHLDSLLVLNLFGNKFSGDIPQTFSKSCQVKSINLSKNRIKGQLPKSLTNCRMLEVLDMGHNQINDTFPAWLGSLPKLEVLVLSHNMLHGFMASPKTRHDFPCLRIIDISHNFLEGSLPYTYMQTWKAMEISKAGHADSSNSTTKQYFWIGGSINTLDTSLDYSITITNKGHETYYPRILKVFRVVDFSSNNFTGSIPNVFGNLKGLQAVNLSNNNLHGEIPSSLAMITNLESLDLSQNKLRGEIPQQMTQLTSLAIFNVSRNRLVGLVPEGKQFDTFDNSSYDGNFALCGAPLSKKCNALPSPLLKASEEQEEDSELIDWAIRIFGCLSGLIVGFILGKIYIADRHHDWFVETFARDKKPKTTRARRMGR